MGRRIQRLRQLIQESSQLALARVRGPRHGTEAARGPPVGALSRGFSADGRTLLAEFNTWLAALPDTRHQPFVDYDRRLLLWWGLLLFVCKLGSRRQLN